MMREPKIGGFSERLSAQAEARKALLSKMKPKPTVRPEVFETTAQKKARELDFLDFGYIEQLWHRHRTRQADQSFDLWCLINLFSWYECWFA